MSRSLGRLRSLRVPGRRDPSPSQLASTEQTRLDWPKCPGPRSLNWNRDHRRGRARTRGPCARRRATRCLARSPGGLTVDAAQAQSSFTGRKTCYYPSLAVPGLPHPQARDPARTGPSPSSAGPTLWTSPVPKTCAAAAPAAARGRPGSGRQGPHPAFIGRRRGGKGGSG